MTRTTRVLFYSHDSTGLGHLRRTLALAQAVTTLDETATALVLTGSTVASSYRLPPRVDTVKLPAIMKCDDGEYTSRRLTMGIDEIRRLRSEISVAAVRAFQPTVAVVDKTPLGSGGEFVQSLEALRDAGNCRTVLGLRDIDDSPENVRQEWSGKQLRQAIRRYYDDVFVYGPHWSPDALDCLGWNDIGIPIHHVGYVGTPMPESGPDDLPSGYLLVTPGGGGDGFNVLASVARAIRSKPLPCHTVMVTGPLLADEDTMRLMQLTQGLDVRVLDFRADMQSVIAGARAVVAMAGYNTVTELLRAQKPSLLVPRVRPREEQLVRATQLQTAGLVDMLHPDEVSPVSMSVALANLLERERPTFAAADHDGAMQAAKIMTRPHADIEVQIELALDSALPIAVAA